MTTRDYDNEDTEAMRMIDLHAARARRQQKLWLVILIISLALLVLAISAVTVSQMATPIGDYPLPQRVVEKTVAQGGDVIVRGTKCMDLAHVVLGASNWRRVDPPIEFVPFSQGAAFREAGCWNYEFRNQLPAYLTPGRWRLEGHDAANVGPFTQDVFWYTEPFTVTGEIDVAK